MVYKFAIKSSRQKEMINITLDVQDIIRKSNVISGIVMVFIPHTTAGIVINENSDPDLIKDILWKYSELVPRNTSFDHFEGNSDSHILASFVGNSVFVMIEKNSLWMGYYQGIFFVELDGPRAREIWVKIIPDAITDSIPEESTNFQ